MTCMKKLCLLPYCTIHYCVNNVLSIMILTISSVERSAFKLENSIVAIVVENIVPQKIRNHLKQFRHYSRIGKK